MMGRLSHPVLDRYKARFPEQIKTLKEYDPLEAMTDQRRRAEALKFGRAIDKAKGEA